MMCRWNNWATWTVWNEHTVKTQVLEWILQSKIQFVCSLLSLPRVLLFLALYFLLIALFHHSDTFSLAHSLFHSQTLLFRHLSIHPIHTTHTTHFHLQCHELLVTRYHCFRCNSQKFYNNCFAASNWKSWCGAASKWSGATSKLVSVCVWLCGSTQSSVRSSIIRPSISDR